MSSRPPKNTLEAALGNSLPRRFREFALVLFDGEGAICVPNETWLPAAAWATVRPPSGNRLRDRFMLLQRLDVLVTRRGTAMISTTGAHLRLARLRDVMKRENLDLKEWNFPPDEILNQALNMSQKVRDTEARGDRAPASEAGDAPAADSPEDTS